MKKKNFLFLLFIFIFLLNFKIDNINADSCINGVSGSGVINSSGTGGQGGYQSILCTGNICANTDGLTLKNNNWKLAGLQNSKGQTFNNTAVFGIRLTIVDKDNKTKFGPVNFWATTTMMQYVSYNGNIKGYTSYSNMTDPTGSDSNGLYSFPNDTGGLRILDNSSSSYSDYIKSLDETKLNNYLKAIDSRLSISYLSDKKYYVKFEPIFVYHYHNANYQPNDNYFRGTVSEILKMIYNTTFKSASGGRQINDYGINYWSLGALSCGGTYNCNAYGYSGTPIIFQSDQNILLNYIFTLYQTSKPSDTNFPIVDISEYNRNDKSDSNKYEIYDDAMNSNIGLSVAYVDVSCLVINKGSITITKYSGSPSSYDDYDGKAYFELYKKNGSSFKKVKKNSSTDYFTTNADGFLEIKNLDPGKYKIREIKIPSSKKIKKVYMTAFNNGIGEFSINNNSNVTMLSSEFDVISNKKTPISVYNEPEPGTPPPGSGNITLRVSKQLGEYGNSEWYIAPNASTPVTFTLISADNNDIYLNDPTHTKFVSITKNSNAKYVDFKKLTFGTYFLEERIKKSDRLEKVDFRTKLSGDDIGQYNDDISSFDSSQFRTKIIDGVEYYIIRSGAISIDSHNYDTSTKRKYVMVFNKESDFCGCDCQLDQILFECPNNRCSYKIASRLADLRDLYEQYPNYNLLLNYDVISDHSGTYLDTKGLACGSVTCSIDDNFQCSTGSLGFSAKGNTINYDGNRDRLISSFYEHACYDSLDSGIISYNYVPLDINCGISYRYDMSNSLNNNTFIPDTVNSGQFLYDHSPNEIVGTLNINLSCSKSFISTSDDVTSANNSLKDMKIDKSLLLKDIFPDMSISLVSENNVSGIFLYDENLYNDYINPVSSISKCDNNLNCYVSWKESFNVDLLFYNDIFRNNFNLYDDSDASGEFELVKNALPISLNTPSGKNYVANFDFIASNLSSSTFSSKCYYNVENSLLRYGCKPGERCGDEFSIYQYNFDFRIIDTSRPFSGKDGNNRKTGSNWCGGNRIGNKVSYYDANDKLIYYVVGDINNDEIVDGNDLNVDEMTFKSSIAGDIDGDGVITYSPVDACSSNGKLLSDNCILYRYIHDGVRSCSGGYKYNSMINKYINNATNSYSTNLPMYSFTLTASDINKIRSYNKVHSYNDKNLVCTHGKKCLSDFLTNWIKNHTINNQSVSYNLDGNSSSCYNDRYNEKWCSNN